MLIGRRRSRLNEKDVAAPDILLDSHIGFTVRKGADRRLAKGHADVAANALGQLAVGRAAKNFHLRLKREHRAATLGARKRPWQVENLPAMRSLPNYSLLDIAMNTDPIHVERPATNSKFFAHTRWDALPAAAGLFHLAYFFGLFFLYPHAPLWVMLILGFIYSLMVNANINGVGHNFIHNPFFRSTILNRAFGITQSIGCCFSQTMYDAVHIQHHKGNSDRQGETGDTIDWLSIYRHGHDGEAENPW